MKIDRKRTIKLWQFIPFALFTGLFCCNGTSTLMQANDLGEETITETLEVRKVEVAFYFNSLKNINNQNSSFNADFYLTLNWFDPTLVGKKEDGVDWSTVWNPQIECVNSPDYDFPYDPIYELKEGGQVFCYMRVQGTFFSLFDLRRFPFDVQSLPVVFESAEHENDTLEIHYDHLTQPVSVLFGEFHKESVNPEETLSKNIDFTEWRLLEMNTLQTVNYYPFEDSYWSQFRIELSLARRPDFYLWNIVLVIIMLVILAWVIPFMDPKELAPRVGASISLFMAGVAFNLVTTRILPHIPYLTLLDYYVKFNQILIVLVATESLIVNILYKKYQRQNAEEHGFQVAKRIDRFTQIVIPVMFIGLCSLIWLIL